MEVAESIKARNTRSTRSTRSIKALNTASTRSTSSIHFTEIVYSQVLGASAKTWETSTFHLVEIETAAQHRYTGGSFSSGFFRNALQNAGKFGQARPMKHEF